MLKALLVDDEQHALNMLSKVISEREDMQVVGAYNDVAEMLDEIRGLEPDVVFLDIEMPEISGLQLGERLRAMDLDMEIVFVTAYRQYALDAFGVDAVDYLLKPIEADMLDRAIRRIWKRRIHSPAPMAPPTPAVPEKTVAIECFGDFTIHKAGRTEPIRFPTAKAEELFAYLLINRNMNVSKWTLCDSLWPEQANPKNSEHNLHTAVYRMKKVLRDNGIEVRLLSQRGLYRLECDIYCDYITFAQEMDAIMKGDGDQLGVLIELSKLYKGALFAGKDYPWCEAERERMLRYYTVLAKKLASGYAKIKQYNKAIDVLLAMLRHVPYDGEGYEQLLEIFIEVQDKASFVVHYEKMERLFRQELGVTPPQELEQLYQALTTA